MINGFLCLDPTLGGLSAAEVELLAQGAELWRNEASTEVESTLAVAFIGILLAIAPYDISPSLGLKPIGNGLVNSASILKVLKK